MSNIHRLVACSDHWLAGRARAVYRNLRRFSLPTPRMVLRPLLLAFVTGRALHYFAKRVLVCEPLLKAYCKHYGKGLRADVHLPWIQGHGALVLGDDVLIDGKLNVSFAARFCAEPTLTIGDHTGVGHNCSFTVGKRITIGRHCRIASDVWLFDSSGHPADPVQRQAGSPPSADEVRPITIEDNVWIGRRCIIYPGVTIGVNSIVSAGSVVMSDVPPNTVVAGNPARKIAVLASANGDRESA
ncbi:MAG: acyltransferase [Gemmataceae bacterium]